MSIGIVHVVEAPEVRRPERPYYVCRQVAAFVTLSSPGENSMSRTKTRAGFRRRTSAVFSRSIEWKNESNLSNGKIV
jgi:hypothetical protein